MCETYNERGLEHIGISDVGVGINQFLLVAVGGTVIGTHTKSTHFSYKICGKCK